MFWLGRLCGCFPSYRGNNDMTSWCRRTACWHKSLQMFSARLFPPHAAECTLQMRTEQRTRACLFFYLQNKDNNKTIILCAMSQISQSCRNLHHHKHSTRYILLLAQLDTCLCTDRRKRLWSDRSGSNDQSLPQTVSVPLSTSCRSAVCSAAVLINSELHHIFILLLINVWSVFSVPQTSPLFAGG